jgi:SAM-dependent methyltransferase
VANQGIEAYGEYDSGSLKNRIKRFLPLPNPIVARPTLHDRLRDSHVFDAPHSSMILNLGSGVQNKHSLPNLINLDIYPHENTDAVGDAHSLPFLDACIDGVWLCAVMEHIPRPFDVGNDVDRILKPGGFVLATVPFIQPLHGSPHDYFRYTLDGLRSVFSSFEEIEAGKSAQGPFGTWVEITGALVGGLVNNSAISYGMRFLISWLLYPMLLLDKLKLFRKKESTIFGGVCFLGRKR